MQFLIIIFLVLCPLPIARADTAPVDDPQSFPFDKPCLQFNKDTFKVGEALLDVMKEGDFPQYCVLYSLANYHVNEKRDNGYFIMAADPKQPSSETTKVFLKTTIAHENNQVLISTDPSAPKGQWAYFIGPDRFTMANGQDRELYTFQEIDF